MPELEGQSDLAPITKEVQVADMLGIQIAIIPVAIFILQTTKVKISIHHLEVMDF
jgi:hypothetical protein